MMNGNDETAYFYTYFSQRQKQFHSKACLTMCLRKRIWQEFIEIHVAPKNQQKQLHESLSLISRTFGRLACIYVTPWHGNLYKRSRLLGASHQIVEFFRSNNLKSIIIQNEIRYSLSWCICVQLGSVN